MVTIHDSMEQGRVAEAISIYYTVVKFLEGAAAFLGIGMQRSRSATSPILTMAARYTFDQWKHIHFRFPYRRKSICAVIDFIIVVGYLVKPGTTYHVYQSKQTLRSTISIIKSNFGQPREGVNRQTVGIS